MKRWRLQADATDESAVAAAITPRPTARRPGAIDVLHNNVGYGGSGQRRNAWRKFPMADWEREISINLTSAYLGIRHVAPLMRAAGGGAITNISSLLAVRALRSPSVGYAAAKAGVEAMTRACAAGYGRDNIRVNCIRIGFSETPLLKLSLDAREIPLDQQEAAMNRSRGKVPLRAEHTDPFDRRRGRRVPCLRRGQAHHRRGPKCRRRSRVRKAALSGNRRKV